MSNEPGSIPISHPVPTLRSEEDYYKEGGIFFGFFYYRTGTSFNTAFASALQTPLCRRMLGSKLGKLTLELARSHCG
jgi:hypothetical protein